jgi:hypothetical protein
LIKCIPRSVMNTCRPVFPSFRECAMALCAIICPALSGSIAFGQQYPFIPVAGSPRSERALFQDSRGRLWIAGEQLACFDGTRFFLLHDYGFPSVASYDIAEDSSGAIWIGAETGVYRFSNGKVEEITKGVAVSVIATTPEMAIAAVGPLGSGIPAKAALVRIEWTGTSWKAETVINLDSPGPLTLDLSGTLLYPWTASQWGEIRLQDVVRWRPGTQLAVIHDGSPGGRPVNSSWKIMRDRAGCLWVGGPGGAGVNCGGRFRQMPFPGANVLGPMQEAADGRVVLWGNNLVGVGRPGSFQIATRANGLPGIGIFGEGWHRLARRWGGPIPLRLPISN